jgi:hypothetical protein
LLEHGELYYFLANFKYAPETIKMHHVPKSKKHTPEHG